MDYYRADLKRAQEQLHTLREKRRNEQIAEMEAQEALLAQEKQKSAEEHAQKQQISALPLSVTQGEQDGGSSGAGAPPSDMLTRAHSTDTLTTQQQQLQISHDHSVLPNTPQEQEASPASADM